MPDIFLSYSREDQPVARLFAEGFEREGLSVWWDVTLKAGEVYDKVTEQALEGARAVVVLWSRHSVESRWVRSEATTADRSGKLVPVMIGPCRRPIQFELMHSLDLSGWKGSAQDPAWQSLLASIRNLMEHPRAAPASPIEQASGRRRKAWVVLAAVAGFTLLLAATAHFLSAKAPGQAATAAEAPSIAVLPFANMSSDKEQEYFSDGLSEELLNELAQVRGLRVIGRTSSFTFKGRNEDLRKIGETLGVNHILEGSVRKAGDRVRITAQLIDPVDGSHLWSETYERQLDDIFAVQEEIARTVAEQLQLKMGVRASGNGSTKNLQAYEAFLTGRALMGSVDGDSVRRALPHLERAIAADPAYLTAKLWLIEAYSRAEIFEPAGTGQVRSKRDALIDGVATAVPGSPLASLALSYRAWNGTDLVELERLLKGAMLIPGEAGNQARFRYGRLLLGLGRLQDARTQTIEALRVDPLDFFAHVRLYEILEAAGDFQAAEQELAKFLQLPGGSNLNTLGGWINLSQSRGDLVGLRKAIDDLLAAGAGQPFLRKMQGVPLEDAAAYRKALREQIGSQGFPGNVASTTRIAQWAGFFEDRELALQAFDVMRRQDFSIDTMAEELWRPSLARLRNEPKFHQMLRELGLVGYWRATGRWGQFCKPAGSDAFECR